MIMEKSKQKRQFSVTRAKTRRKPRLLRRELDFYQAAQADQLVLALTQPLDKTALTKVVVNQDETDEQAHQVTYQIFGGFDHNAIKINLAQIDQAEHTLDWVGLMTFTGFQFKYVKPGKQEFIFALADEDAYAYCGKDPCEECVFKCKNGFKIYLHCQQHGLFCFDVSPRSVINNKL
jgi:hypothetical protein